MANGYRATAKALDFLADDGLPEWVLEELSIGLHESVVYILCTTSPSHSRARKTYTAVVASLIMNALESYEVAPFYGAIAEALNEAEIPKQLGGKPWNRHDIVHIVNTQDLKGPIAAFRHEDNPAFLRYLRDNPKVTRWDSL